MRRKMIILILVAGFTAFPQENRSPARDTSDQRGQAVTRINKSSTLIGIEARTSDNKPIGKVRDVVLDINSGRIAYFVVDAAEILGRNNSLIAVPPFAVRSAPRQQVLFLDADTQKIRNLRTFTANSYPAIRGSIAQHNRWNRSEASIAANPQPSRQSTSSGTSRLTPTESDDWHVHEWFLITPDDEVALDELQQGSDRSTQRQAARSPHGYSDYTGSDHGSGIIPEDQYSSAWDGNGGKAVGGTSGIESSQQGSNAASENSQKSAQQTRMFYGQIKDIHQDNRTLTVESDRKTLTFELAPAPQLRLNKGEGTRFSHFHEGQWVEIEYRYQDGANVAFGIAETGYIAPNE